MEFNDELLSVTDTPVYNLVLASSGSLGSRITISFQYVKGNTFVVRDDDLVSLVFKNKDTGALITLPCERVYYNAVSFEITKEILKNTSPFLFDVVILRSDGTRIISNDNSVSEIVVK